VVARWLSTFRAFPRSKTGELDVDGGVERIMSPEDISR
jgi:hypothetical protein